MSYSRLSAISRAGVVALAAGMLVALSACGRADDAGAAVEQASYKIKALGLGGANPMASATHRVQTYNEVLTLVQAHTNASRPGTAAAASLLSARAHEGLATIQAEEASELERQFLMKTTAARAALDRFVTQQSLALSLESYDPGPRTDELGADKRHVERELAAASAAHLALERQTEALENAASAASGLARDERTEETKLRQQAIAVGAVEQAELIERANQHRRAADGHDREAADIRARMAHVAPDLAAAEDLIERLRRQVREIDGTRDQVDRFAQLGRQQATDARADAANASEQIRSTLNALAAIRAEVQPAVDKAVSTFDRAVSAARQAERTAELGADTRTQAKITLAVAQQGRAALLTAHARGLASYAALLESLLEAEPALPNVAEYRGTVSQAREAAEAAQQRAAEALEAASTAYKGAGSRPEGLANIAALLDAVNESLAGNRDAFAAVSRPARAAQPDSGDAASGGESGEEAEIRQMFVDLVDAFQAGDLNRALQFIHTQSAEERRLLASFVDLDAACRERFGRGLSDQADQMGGGMGGFNLPEMDFSPDDLEITMLSPTSALVAPRGEDEELPVVKHDGVWRLQLPMPAEMAGMSSELAGIFEKVAADVRSGAIASEEQLGPAIMERLMPIIMREMQRQGGPR